MMAVSINTRPSIRVVRTLPSASGWRAMLSVELAVARPIPIPPPAAATPTAIPAARAFSPMVLSSWVWAAGSPSGAVAAILCFVFLGQTMNGLQLVSVVLVVLGVILLSVFDMKDENKARRFRGEVIEEKYAVSALAVSIPIIYCIVDALGTFGDSLVLDAWALMSEEEGEIAYEFTFFLCAVAAFIFLVFVKKQKFSLWEEREKGLGAICETAGQFFYIYAIAENGIMAAPLISSYCLFSVVLSRIFLKEKLTLRQYGAIAIAGAGIILMGALEGA